MFSKEQPNPYRSLPDSEQITDPAKIVRLLERFTEHYTPLTVQIPDHKKHFTSCIVDVASKYVLLDELLPTNGHELLVEKEALLVTGKLDGIVIQFFTTLKRVDNKDNILTYYMKLPKLLEYQQRRQAYRARIPISRELPVFIEDKNGKMIKGELRNLSHGGAGMIFMTEKAIMERGRQHNCVIMLTDGSRINCTAELRFWKNIAAHDKQYIGVQFVDLEPIQSRLIGRCINELERDLISKRATH